MKIMRAGAFAGSLLLFPALALAQDELIWRSAQPAWAAANFAAPDDKAKAPGLALAQPAIQACSATEPVNSTSASISDEVLEVEWRRSPPDEGTYASQNRPGKPTLPNGVPDDPYSPIVPFIKSDPLNGVDSTGEPQRPKIMPPDVAPVAPSLVIPPVRAGTGQGSSSGQACPRRPILSRLPGKSTAEQPGDCGTNDGIDLTKLADPPRPTLQVSADYLLWWTKGDHVPVLASTGTTDSLGILGRPGTRTLYGPGNDDIGERSGGRLSAVLWLDSNSPYGVEGGFLFLANHSGNFAANSNQYPVLSRPVFVVNNGMENAETVAFPNFSTGTLTIQTENHLWGADANVVRRILGSSDRSINLFAGYQYLNLSESIAITERITAGPLAPDPLGTRTIVNDTFATRNVFNGGAIGASFEQQRGKWFVNALGGIGFGATQETVDVAGSQLQFRPGLPPAAFTGGLLAAQSNIGQYARSRFSVVPEFALNLGYQITPHLRAYVGYSFLYWTSVVRPGEQIDRSVDLTFIPNSPPVAPSGERRPAVGFQTTDFWAQGVNFGVEWRW